MDEGKDEFKHFEVVAAEANDHHFLTPKHNKTNGHDALNSSFQSIVTKEWKILEENLPDAIYVRAYETRTNLIRAVIIGAPGTPYHDCLFFFDISLPPNYPNTPPTVHYHSHGYSLNPNLYSCGYVCLSLVNTWQGSEEEMWSKDSTILQVLVSIQGLVLNQRPYFNEPGNEDYLELESTDGQWANESVRYSEDAFVCSCKTLVQIVKKPPEGFEDFVVGHFRARAKALLAAVERYQGGDVVAGESSSLDQNSSSFKTDLLKIGSMISEALVALDEVNNDGATLNEVKKRCRDEEDEEEETEAEAKEEGGEEEEEECVMI